MSASISTLVPATAYKPPTHLGMDMTGEIVGRWEIIGHHDDFLMWVNLISKNNGGKND